MGLGVPELANLDQILQSEINCYSNDALVDGDFRFWLTRVVQDTDREHLKVLTWIMLNPSTATAVDNDPTIKRVEKFTENLGYDVAVVVNIYPYRSPKPSDLNKFKESDEFSTAMKKNARWINRAMSISDQIIAAWGTNGGEFADKSVDALGQGSGRIIGCLGLTLDGCPKHPLARGKHRIPDDAKLIQYVPQHKFNKE